MVLSRPRPAEGLRVYWGWLGVADTRSCLEKGPFMGGGGLY